MKRALLCYVGIPYTQEVLDILSLLSIDIYEYHRDIKVKRERDCALFIYNCNLELEEVDYGIEWILNSKDVMDVLVMYANKDFNGICKYLNNIPERPFNVFVAGGN